ncbi:hypothetical protein C7M84_006961 [Penaeus vannamei]|uniref:Uncharacterized protein n=1 Tax=Penaeus vannamei TaxID=6689 RepID=A0A3R7PR86_PENVA|nr:hypothetical protein C7M84_006961 [Penaeus vannamei]
MSDRSFLKKKKKNTGVEVRFEGRKAGLWGSWAARGREIGLYLSGLLSPAFPPPSSASVIHLPFAFSPVSTFSFHFSHPPFVCFHFRFFPSSSSLLHLLFAFSPFSSSSLPHLCMFYLLFHLLPLSFFCFSPFSIFFLSLPHLLFAFSPFSIFFLFSPSPSVCFFSLFHLLPLLSLTFCLLFLPFPSSSSSSLLHLLFAFSPFSIFFLFSPSPSVCFLSLFHLLPLLSFTFCLLSLPFPSSFSSLLHLHFCCFLSLSFFFSSLLHFCLLSLPFHLLFLFSPSPSVCFLSLFHLLPLLSLTFRLLSFSTSLIRLRALDKRKPLLDCERLHARSNPISPYIIRASLILLFLLFLPFRFRFPFAIIFWRRSIIFGARSRKFQPQWKGR